MSTSTDLARATIRSLIETGVSNFVLSPGSRNAPLSIALIEAEAKGLIELHVKIDERGAAFFALGISKATDQYVAVICTSGTAVANYHPAALEALHAQNKLLFLTADRPARLRNTGANQTTNQVGIFPGIPSHDLTAPAKLELTGGPIQINLQFDEPLLPSDNSDWLAGIKINSAPLKAEVFEQLSLIGDGVVVVGHDSAGIAKGEIQRFIKDLGLPVIAEDPTSYPEAISHASIFLADEKVRNYLKPDFVIVIGRTTLSRSINAYIASAQNQYVIDARTKEVDRAREATGIFTSLPNISLESNNPSWVNDWNEAARISHETIGSLNVWNEQACLQLISKELPNDSALFVGSSRPIRDIEGFAKPRNGVSIFANRGLAGIDGNLSTIFGISTQYKSTFAVIGDLTFLHDLSALVNLPKSNLTIFLVDNNGGGIFSTLPQAGVVGFEKIFGTPQNQNLARIVDGFGIKCTKVKSLSDLSCEMVHDNSGIKFVILEVPDRESNAFNLKRYYELVSSALRIGFNLD
jgi:2-succinyl-5-enolpyruvyl-6-hydroxy-3-cyclohexene-1-carboxylate synthase